MQLLSGDSCFAKGGVTLGDAPVCIIGVPNGQTRTPSVVAGVSCSNADWALFRIACNLETLLFARWGTILFVRRGTILFVRKRTANTRPAVPRALRSLYRLDLSRNQLCGLDAFGLGACNLTGVRALCVALDANSKLHALAIFAHNRLPLEAASALHEVAASKEHLDLDWGADRTSRRSQASVSVAIADAEASQPSPSAVRTPAARASGTAWAAARRCTVAPVLRPLAVADAADNAVCVGDASARDECAPEDSCASLLVHEQWHRWQLSPPVSPDVTPTRKSGALRTPSRFSPARFSGIRVSSVDIGERHLNAASMIDEASLCSCTGLTSAEDCRDMGI
eukprot:5006185-Pleurochrysis_carterae.AAC.1